MSDLTDKLLKQMAKAGTAPFLFVGSGLSRRYLRLEDWATLLQRFAEPLSKPYEYYRAKANSDLPSVASLMADEFYDLWWADPAFEASREANGKLIAVKEDCLKLEIAGYVGSKAFEEGQDPNLDEEVALLKKSVIDGVITTNWDTFLESTFPDYEVYVGQEEVLFSPSHGVAEIYKIHGCVTNPPSLVLTQSDYDRFNQRNAYLAARLLTTFVDHPIIFIGYSLSDANIIDILGQVVSCLSTENANRLADRLIFLQRDSAGLGDMLEYSVLQLGTHTLPITLVRTNDFRGVFGALASIQRRFPARLLRTMKEHVYELVSSNDPKGKIAVVDIEKADHYQDLEVVFGVGLSNKVVSDLGYKAIQREDLLKDVVTGQADFDPQRIVEDTLPKIVRSPSQYVPVHKYLRQAGRYDDDGELKTAGLDDRVVEYASEGPAKFLPPHYLRARKPDIEALGGIPAILDIEPPERAIFLIPLLREDQIDTGELRKFLTNNLHQLTSKTQLNRTYIGSLVCLYDLLAYGPSAGPKKPIADAEGKAA